MNNGLNVCANAEAEAFSRSSTHQGRKFVARAKVVS